MKHACALFRPLFDGLRLLEVLRTFHVVYVVRSGCSSVHNMWIYARVFICFLGGRFREQLCFVFASTYWGKKRAKRSSTLERANCYLLLSLLFLFRLFFCLLRR